MDTNVVSLIYFSPTGTTKKIVDQIAAGFSEGFPLAAVERLDLTPASSRTSLPTKLRGSLAVIGSPVYCGRIPSEVTGRLARISSAGVPAVIVAVYGSRAYEDAIIELRDVATERGFRVIAAGAFIGEHSFSSEAAPIAKGRPDIGDLQRAQELGKAVSAKISSARTIEAIPVRRLPGDRPYRELTPSMRISPISQKALCAKCGKCIAVCPMAAITHAGAPETDRDSCILCCACVKSCSTGARIFDNAKFVQIVQRLVTNCSHRKEPETFL
jgi:ferredoxin